MGFVWETFEKNCLFHSATPKCTPRATRDKQRNSYTKDQFRFRVIDEEKRYFSNAAEKRIRNAASMLLTLSNIMRLAIVIRINVPLI